MLRRICLAFALIFPACASTPTALGKVAPSFHLTDNAGQVWSSDTMKSGTYLLDFWATWCQPCLETIPALDAFNKKYGNTVKLLGLAADTQGWSVVRPAIKKRDIEYAVALADSSLVQAYNVDSIPNLVVIHNGIVVKELVGTHTLAGLEKDLAEYLH